MRPNLEREAKALAVPTRNQIFGYIADSSAPVGVAELTAYLGLNHNAIRQHLAVLVEAELVSEMVEGDGGRGRPRLLYELHPHAAGLWETSGPYEYLASLFAIALDRGLSPREIGAAAGREAAAAVDLDTDAVDVIEAEMHQRGFEPERLIKGSSKVDFVLGRCPFEDVAAENPNIVCQLHLGLVEGLVEGLGGLEVLGLTTKNSHRAGCRVSLRHLPTARD